MRRDALDSGWDQRFLLVMPHRGTCGLVGQAPPPGAVTLGRPGLASRAGICLSPLDCACHLPTRARHIASPVRDTRNSAIADIAGTKPPSDSPRHLTPSCSLGPQSMPRCGASNNVLVWRGALQLVLRSVRARFRRLSERTIRLHTAGLGRLHDGTDGFLCLISFPITNQSGEEGRAWRSLGVMGTRQSKPGGELSMPVAPSDRPGKDLSRLVTWEHKWRGSRAELQPNRRGSRGYSPTCTSHVPRRLAISSPPGGGRPGRFAISPFAVI